MFQNKRHFFIATLFLIALVCVAGLALNTHLRLDAVQELRQEMQRIPPDAAFDFDTADNLAKAQQAVELAFNLLGLFEALSLAITIGGVVLAAYGFSNFNTAKEQLDKTRKQVLDEINTYRERFDREINVREAELKALRTELEVSAERERQSTSKALLANALIPLGERQYRASDYTGALNTYNRALELDPLNPVVNQRLAYVYTQSGNLEQAKQHYERAIEREPDFAPALAGLGYVQRRFAERLDKDLSNDLHEDLYLQRQIERDQLLNKSEDLLLSALKISPKLVDDDGESWWGVLGGLYKRRGQLEQAVDSYRRATEVTPQSSYGYVNLAALYMKQGQREKMIETYRRVERIASTEALGEQGNFWGYADFITASFAIGKVEQAQEALPIAISIAPLDSPFMLSSLLETLKEMSVILDEQQVPEIQKAVARLDTELQHRAAHQKG